MAKKKCFTVSILVTFAWMAVAAASSIDPSTSKVCRSAQRAQELIEAYAKNWTLQKLNLKWTDSWNEYGNYPLRDRLRYLQRFTWYPSRRISKSSLVQAFELALGYETALTNLQLDAHLHAKPADDDAQHLKNLEQIEKMLISLANSIKGHKLIRKCSRDLNFSSQSASNFWDYVPVDTPYAQDVKAFITFHEIVAGLDEFQNIFSCAKIRRNLS
ncbi:uncharacterized protein LOC125178664 [Hyalella azteca]|uniref:Uncharacterized protein LOC125178664 n=1 Tax=Hyalella azteca TaxID=294128 RepID=A0A979FRY1_HYAAZ|nr:uncharacterized protein LOC125178664 [Hyalella azteca]